MKYLITCVFILVHLVSSIQAQPPEPSGRRLREELRPGAEPQGWEAETYLAHRSDHRQEESTWASRLRAGSDDRPVKGRRALDERPPPWTRGRRLHGKNRRDQSTHSN